MKRYFCRLCGCDYYKDNILNHIHRKDPYDVFLELDSFEMVS